MLELRRMNDELNLQDPRLKEVLKRNGLYNLKSVPSGTYVAVWRQVRRAIGLDDDTTVLLASPQIDSRGSY